MSTKLKLTEIFGVTSFVCGTYLFLLYSLSHFIVSASSIDDFWGYLPSVWDHPEPNYVFLHWICEFFSVITAIPIAGYLLMYNAWKYDYNNIGHNKVIGLYVIICSMYSFAFIAHSTLSPLLMSITLTAVLTNGVYTFYQYSYITKWRLLQPNINRLIICIIAESIIIYSVIKLPYILGEFGGVPTLTVVQTPAVSFATLLVYLELKKTEKRNGKNKKLDMLRKRKLSVYKLLLFSGLMLCAAMTVSFVEILMNRQSVNIFNCFPYLHVTIHILEQIGIYNYGIGVAALQYLVISNEPKSCLEYCSVFAYIHREKNTKKSK